ncbi:MAG: hypothetical protein ACD_3C00026G0010 [uncultured bacterium (gcode 4)]|uniref:Uncharacterized protein n=1 Tax=uncultured bacterium (gcode 4) TaxID=1234023 RepID=K2GEP2_9BACT|nr:MAG: hypothetical protein ACD_3C00026G0010 [uncultured bacterium (gcode 4)]
MRQFISDIPATNIPWFLDTPEKISSARTYLESATEISFEKLRVAQLRTLERAQNIILD